jgi:hypothetical protein
LLAGTHQRSGEPLKQRTSTSSPLPERRHQAFRTFPYLSPLFVDWLSTRGPSARMMSHMDRPIISTDLYAEFAREWIEAWNAHDLDRILSHYRDDVRFVSPLAARAGAPQGTVHGLPALRNYFERGLASYPALHFQPIAALGGVGSIALHYRSVEDRQTIEVMELDARGQVRRAAVHYGRAEQDREMSGQAFPVSQTTPPPARTRRNP